MAPSNSDLNSKETQTNQHTKCECHLGERRSFGATWRGQVGPLGLSCVMCE